MTSARRRHRARCARPRGAALGREPLWDRFERLVQALHAEGALRPRAAHHHRADGDPAIGRRLRVHGAALEDGDAPPVRRGGRRTSRRSSTSIESYPQDADNAQLRRIAQERLGLVVEFLPVDRHAAAGPEAVLLAARPGAVGRAAQADRPAVLDRHGRPLGAGRDPHPARQRGDARVRARAAPPTPRTRTSSCSGWSAPRWCCSASPSLFLRNQIRPILRLADAAESFGKGREVPNFRPRGAREVRRAAHAFIEMKRRIERAIEQRTAMLAGVSHDLRTILTRFKLELALLERQPRGRGDEEGRRRDEPHARGLSRLRARRCRRAVGADRHGRRSSTS